MKKPTRLLKSLLAPALLTVVATGCVAVGTGRGHAVHYHDCDPGDQFLIDVTAAVVELVFRSICD